MVCVVHFVLVGHTVETLVGSLRCFPVDRVVLVLGVDEGLVGERIARETALGVRRALRGVVFEDFFVDLDDVCSASLCLVEKIVEEKRRGSTVLVNLSGGLRSAGIAAYLAAQVTGVRAYIGLPEYRGRKVVGVRGVVDVPFMPLKKVSEGKKEILLKLLWGDKYVGELIGCREKTGAVKSLISYHLRDLREEGLVEVVKEGRKVRVKLTFAGRLYALSLK